MIKTVLKGREIHIHRPYSSLAVCQEMHCSLLENAAPFDAIANTIWVVPLHTIGAIDTAEPNPLIVRLWCAILKAQTYSESEIFTWHLFVKRSQIEIPKSNRGYRSCQGWKLHSKGNSLAKGGFEGVENVHSSEKINTFPTVHLFHQALGVCSPEPFLTVPGAACKVVDSRHLGCSTQQGGRQQEAARDAFQGYVELEVHSTPEDHLEECTQYDFFERLRFYVVLYPILQ